MKKFSRNTFVTVLNHSTTDDIALRMTRFLVLCAVSILLLLPVHAKESKLPEPLAPSSPWNVNWTETTCELKRRFGTEDNAMVAVFVQDTGMQTLDLLLILQSRERKVLSVEAFVDTGTANERSKHNLQIYPSAEKGLSVWRMPGIARDHLNKMRDGEVLTLSPSKTRKPIALRLDDIEKAASALEKCERDLLEKLGFDFDKLANLSRKPEPRGSPARWVNALDYPTSALRKGFQGSVIFQVEVGPDGSVGDCTILFSSGYKPLDNVVCRSLSRRAQFIPALDKSGKPVKAPYVNTVRFELP